MEGALVDRHLVVADAVDVVGDAHRHLLQPGEHVELGEHEVGDAVDPRGVAGDDGVVPAAAPRASGGGAVLGADLAQVLAGVVAQLGGERALADARGVGLHDADHLVDAGGRDAGARARATGGGGARGDERVGAVVDVEQGGLAGLQEHGVAAVERLVQQQPGVADVGLEPVGEGAQLVDGLGDRDRAAVVDLGEDLVLELQHALDLRLEDLLVEEVLHPDADPVHLVGVGGADAAAGGADPPRAEEPLGDLVEGAVVVGDHVGAGAELEPARVDAARLEPVDLLEQHAEVDDDAVADHRRDARRQDAAGQQVQGVLLVADDDRVPGVVAAVELHDEVDTAAEQVGGLALALVAPLGADDHGGGHR